MDRRLRRAAGVQQGSSRQQRTAIGRERCARCVPIRLRQCISPGTGNRTKALSNASRPPGARELDTAGVDQLREPHRVEFTATVGRRVCGERGIVQVAPATAADRGGSQLAPRSPRAPASPRGPPRAPRAPVTPRPVRELDIVGAVNAGKPHRVEFVDIGLIVAHARPSVATGAVVPGDERETIAAAGASRPPAIRKGRCRTASPLPGQLLPPVVNYLQTARRQTVMSLSLTSMEGLKDL